MNLFGINGWEMLVLGLIALLVIGPDKLPGFVSDARRTIRQLKRMADDARTEVTSQLGPEFSDIDLKDLNPRTFVKKHLFDDEDLDKLNPFKDDPAAVEEQTAPRSDARPSTGSTTAVHGRSPASAHNWAAPLPTEDGARYDADAT